MPGVTYMTEKGADSTAGISLLGSFSRSQVSAGLGTAADYIVLFGLTEIFHVWYVASVAIGAFIGAVSNFLINRHWSFKAGERGWHGQAMRYTLVSGISLILNTYGVFWVTEFLGIHYALSVLGVGLAVGIFYNYPLHRFFVFR